MKKTLPKINYKTSGTVKELYDRLVSEVYDTQIFNSSHLEGTEVFPKIQEAASRLANIFAIKNVWTLFNNENRDFYNEKVALIVSTEIDGVATDRAEMLNGHMRIWKLYTVEENWYVAFDLGNGWYAILSRINSLKII